MVLYSSGCTRPQPQAQTPRDSHKATLMSLESIGNAKPWIQTLSSLQKLHQKLLPKLTQQLLMTATAAAAWMQRVQMECWKGVGRKATLLKSKGKQAPVEDSIQSSSKQHHLQASFKYLRYDQAAVESPFETNFTIFITKMWALVSMLTWIRPHHLLCIDNAANCGLDVLGILTILTCTVHSLCSWVIVDCTDNITRHYAKGQDTWVRSQCGKQSLCSRSCLASNHNQFLTELVCYARLIRCLVYTGGRWRLGAKHFFNQRGAKVTAVDYHSATGMLVVGFSNGIFDLFEVRRLYMSFLLCHVSPCCSALLAVTLC